MKMSLFLPLAVLALLGCFPKSNLPPEKMVLIKGGEFIMGTSNRVIDSILKHHGFPRSYIQNQYPPHEVELDAFYIDQYEVTNEAYQKFIEENPEWSKSNNPDSLHNGNYLEHWQGNNFPESEGNVPVYNISWYAAVAFCQWQNKRLPTEAEWEFVASNRGKDKDYPWGNAQPDSLKGNFQNYHGKAIAVGSYPPNNLGVYDLAGNLWEYTLDAWETDFYEQSSEDNPVNGQKYYDFDSLKQVKTRRVIRGGSWGGAPINLRVSFRDSHPPEGAGDHVGCRCVRDIE